MTTRRQILKAAVAPMIVPSVVLGQRTGAVPPSDKITLGGIGIGSRGAHVLSKFLNIEQVKFLAICDVRNERREEIKSIADKKYGNSDCQMYDDQYALLARQDIDAVLIATAHRVVDYQQLADWTPCIVDTRNVMAGVKVDPGKVWKA